MDADAGTQDAAVTIARAENHLLLDGCRYYGMHRKAIPRAQQTTQRARLRCGISCRPRKRIAIAQQPRRRIFPLGSLSYTADVGSPKSPAHRDGVADEHKAIRRSSKRPWPSQWVAATRAP